ncbi:MAG: DUF2336 domain-containing protein [Methylobacterium mesophilicum]|nr:DUF2336 domain-containing protein [Methylobacterium mesophilicum]
MIVEFFLKWVRTAPVSERAAASAALARAFCDGRLRFEERCAAEAALTFLLDDPSPRVRAALADALSMSRNAPPQVIAALAADQPEIAGMVIARSPLLGDPDLVERVALGAPAIQKLVAARPVVSIAVSAALTELGAQEAVLALLENEGAEIAPLSFRRAGERFGDCGVVREVLLRDPRLPADCRHALLMRLGDALRSAPLVAASIGALRAETVVRDACARAVPALIETVPSAEYPALVEHLRLQGQLTESLLLRAVAMGHVAFLAATLSALTGRDASRVAALLAGRQPGPVAALFRKAGLKPSLDGVLLCAVGLWQEVASGKRVAGAQEVSYAMLQACGHGLPVELTALLKKIHLDALRENARRHALTVMAA